MNVVHVPVCNSKIQTSVTSAYQIRVFVSVGLVPFMLGALGYFKIIAIDPLEKEKITLLKVDQTLYFESYKLVMTFV